MKTCSTCAKSFPLKAFGKSIKTKDGYSDDCKDCRAVLTKIRADDAIHQDCEQCPVSEPYGESQCGSSDALGKAG